MRLINGMDRAQFHDKAWALWQEKALGKAMLPKLSFYVIRTLWDVLYDSMAASEQQAAREKTLQKTSPPKETVMLTTEQRESIAYAATWLARSEDIGNQKHAERLQAFLASAAPAEGQVTAKPRVHINGWRVETQPFPHLRGFANKHPELGDTFVRTSSLVSIETRNTVYVLGKPNSEQQVERAAAKGESK